MQIGVTGSGAPDLDQHLTRTRLGHRHLAELRRLLCRDKLKSLHHCSLAIGEIFDAAAGHSFQISADAMYVNTH
jgi:hypothetical protein